ncbi:response regulator [Streptomyces sp. NPDC055239]
MTVRVLLADDQPLVRASLRMVITDAPDLVVAGEAGDGIEAVRLAAELSPDVVVMDIRMPGMDGIEATRRIVEGPGLGGAVGTEDSGLPHVVVLTTFDEDENVYGALRAGAAGFLVKDMDLDEILNGIRVVAAGDGLIAPSVTRRLIKEFAARPTVTPPPAGVLDAITDREREVLTLVGSGLSNSEIAERLHITVATAKTYLTRLLAKLNARDRVQLVILAYEVGLVGPDW